MCCCTHLALHVLVLLRFEGWIHHILHPTGVIILFVAIAAILDSQLLLTTLIGILCT